MRSILSVIVNDNYKLIKEAKRELYKNFDLDRMDKEKNAVDHFFDTPVQDLYLDREPESR